ncbi:MAG: caspase family protein [Chloroflexia bacterium]
MTDQNTRGGANLHALLIGIDCYLPNSLPNGSYPCLQGCVRDINHVSDFLKTRLGVPDERITRLTASNVPGSTQPAEPAAQWPTYANMVNAFGRLTSTAKPLDEVYIHYSGHGGRATTIYPNIKTNGIDEALVPTDIGHSEAQYLRDLELGALLHTMVNSGLGVTIVLDSCHSGGATRGQDDFAVRGIGGVDTTYRPARTLLAPRDEIEAAHRVATARGTRILASGSGWLPAPQSYVLLAACRPTELACEFAFDGTERNGALTYWLLDSLRDIGPGLTYKMVHDRVLAKVHGQFDQQTPQLEGDDSLVVFGSDHVQPSYHVGVLNVDDANNKMTLEVGQSAPVRAGAQFAVYPPATDDFTRIDTRLALVTLDPPGSVTSIATITARLRPDAIQQGSQAVMLDPGDIRLRRKARLVTQGNDYLPAAIDQAAALAAVEAALTADATGFIQLVGTDEATDYQVAINPAGAYEIWDAAGMPVPNLRPALAVDAQGAGGQVAARLIHLAKYRNVRELDNFDTLSPLAHKLVVEFLGTQPDYQPGDQPNPQPFADAGNTPTVNTGDWAFVQITNRSGKDLNVAVLDLAPDWSIAQAYPTDTAFETIEAGDHRVLPLQSALPEGYTGGTDLIKVFATTGTTDFRWLELPALDRPMQPRGAITRGADPLEALLATLADPPAGARNLTTASTASQEWTVASVELHSTQAGQPSPPQSPTR